MVEPATSATQLVGLHVAGKRLVHGDAGAQIQKICRRPDVVLRSRPDPGENGGVNGVGVFFHGCMRPRLRCESARPDPIHDFDDDAVGGLVRRGVDGGSGVVEPAGNGLREEDAGDGAALVGVIRPLAVRAAHRGRLVESGLIGGELVVGPSGGEFGTGAGVFCFGEFHGFAVFAGNHSKVTEKEVDFFPLKR